jgi:hypothetical protein
MFRRFSRRWQKFQKARFLCDCPSPETRESWACTYTKFDKINIRDGDNEYSYEEEASPNRSNTSLTRQNMRGKQKKLDLTVSDFTMRLGYVGRVKGIHRSDLDPDADTSVVGKEA